MILDVRVRQQQFQSDVILGTTVLHNSRMFLSHRMRHGSSKCCDVVMAYGYVSFYVFGKSSAFVAGDRGGGHRGNGGHNFTYSQKQSRSHDLKYSSFRALFIWIVIVNWILAPKNVRCLSLEPIKYYCIWKRLFADVIKNLEMGTLSWNIWVDPKCKHKFLYEKKSEVNSTQTEEEKAVWHRGSDFGNAVIKPRNADSH